VPQSQYLSDATLNWFRGTAFPAAPTLAVYISLHSSDPGPNGTNGDITAIIAGARSAAQLDAFGVPAARPAGGRQISNTSRILFTDNAVGTGLATHFGIWRSVSGGNFLAYGLLTPPTTILIGDTVEFPIGQLVIGVPSTIVS
jgi:hypothetical protein